MRATAKSTRCGALGRGVLRGGRAADIGGFPDDDAADQKARPVGLGILAAVFVAIGLLRLPLPAVLLVAIPLSIAITFAMRRRAMNGMNSDESDLDAGWTFG
jgi:hypothetical protein